MIVIFISVIVVTIFSLKNSAGTSAENELTLSLMKRLNKRHSLLVTKSGAFDTFKFLSTRNISTKTIKINSLVLSVTPTFQNELHSDFPIMVILNIDYQATLPEISVFLPDELIEENVRRFSWLLFTKRNFDLDISLLFRIPYTCEFFIVEKINSSYYDIKENYSYKQKSWTKNVGSWWMRDGLEFKETYLLGRRNNLDGMYLYMLHVMNNCPQVKMDCGNIWLWNEFTTLLNFSTIIVSSQLEIDLIDAWTKVLPILNSRSDLMIFPLFQVKLYMYLKEPEEKKTSWDAYLQPFPNKLWLMVVAWIGTCFASFLVTTLLFQIKENKKSKSSVDMIHHGFAAFDAITNQDGVSYWEDFHRRLILLMARIFGFVVVSHYLATFISFLTVTRLNLPFTSFKGYLRKKKYSMIIKNQSFEHWTAMFSLNQTKARFETFKVPEIAKKICSKKKYVVLAPDQPMNEIGNCRIKQIRRWVLNVHTGLAMFSNDLVPLFRKKILNFRSSGLMHAVEKSFDVDNTPPIREKEVDFDVILPLVIFLGSFISYALVLLLLELLSNCLFCKAERNPTGKKDSLS